MKKTTRWAWVVSLVAATGAGLVLAFLLSIATNNRTFYEQHYAWLFWVNAGVASLLMVVISILATRMVLRQRRGKFGSRLLLKLASIIALVGVFPGLLIYTVSFQFVSRSIESWFDVKVEGALDAGLALGRSTLDAQVADLAAKTRVAAEALADDPLPPQALALERLREQLSAQDVALVGSTGQVLLASGNPARALVPERPPPALLRTARYARVASQLEGLDDDPAGGGTAANARVRALASIPGSGFQLNEQERFLLVTQRVPTALAANALAVQTAYREYQQRSIGREGLRRMYIGTLTLTLILAVFSALLLSVALFNQLAKPLLLLAEGMDQVARGDLSAKPVFASRDELGGLTRAFADMTGQLSEARAMVQRSVTQLEGARTNLQTILDNLTAGVIVFDRDDRIDTVNPGATRILRLPLSAYRRRRLGDVVGLEAFAAAIHQRFQLHRESPEAGERDIWQDAFELQTAPDRDTLTLLVRGAALPLGARLLVFDDISEVVSAQRSAAWSEVARRLAHEIKNPLTPIQLSAERMQHKLEAKLQGTDQALLVRSVGTIVAQVQSMKRLVDEFRDYARLPAARLAPLDLNTLVQEVLGLYAPAQDAGRLEFDAARALPAILGDHSQLRQVIHNLVQNALDAVADRPHGHVRVHTEASLAATGGVHAVRLVVDDNGPGFPQKVLKRAFEPYVTTKSKGTGLGLAVVKKIADEHQARVRIGNTLLPRAAIVPPDATTTDVGDLHDTPAPVCGAQVSISFSKFAMGGVPGAAAGRVQRCHGAVRCRERRVLTRRQRLPLWPPS